MTKEKRQQIEAQIEDLRRAHRREMAGKVMATPVANRIQRKILKLLGELEEDRCRAAQAARLAGIPTDELLGIVMIPLIADVINAVIADVEGTLRRAGLGETVFGDLAQRIRRDAMAMVDTLAMSRDDMPKLLDVDDQLINSVYKKMLSFIKQRLNIKKQ